MLRPAIIVTVLAPTKSVAPTPPVGYSFITYNGSYVVYNNSFVIMAQ